MSKKIAVVVDNYSREFMNKEMVTFGRKLSDSLGTNTWIITNSTTHNRDIDTIHKNVKLIRLSILDTGSWPPLNHWRYYVFMLWNFRNIECFWLYRGRNYVFATTLWAKLIRAKTVIRLDGANGVTWLGQQLYSLRMRRNGSSKIPNRLSDESIIERKSSTKSDDVRFSREPRRRLKSLVKAVIDFVDRDLPLLLASAILVETPEVAESLKPLSIERKCVLLVNGPSLALMTEQDLVLETSRPPPKEKWVLGAGRIRPSKGFTYLLQSFALLPRSLREEWPLLVLGTVEDQSYFDELSQLIDQLGLGTSVQLRSAVYGREFYDLLGRSSIFVLPSLYGEGQPNVVTEAMYFGCAVIGTKVGAVPFQLDYGRAGVLVEPADVDSLGRALSRLIANDGERRGLGERARERAVNELSFDKSMSSLTEILYRKSRSSQAL